MLNSIVQVCMSSEHPVTENQLCCLGHTKSVSEFAVHKSKGWKCSLLWSRSSPKINPLMWARRYMLTKQNNQWKKLINCQLLLKYMVYWTISVISVKIMAETYFMAETGKRQKLLTLVPTVSHSRARLISPLYSESLSNVNVHFQGGSFYWMTYAIRRLITVI